MQISEQNLSEWIDNYRNKWKNHFIKSAKEQNFQNIDNIQKQRKKMLRMSEKTMES